MRVLQHLVSSLIGILVDVVSPICPGGGIFSTLLILFGTEHGLLGVVTGTRKHVRKHAGAV